MRRSSWAWRKSLPVLSVALFLSAAIAVALAANEMAAQAPTDQAPAANAPAAQPPAQAPAIQPATSQPATAQLSKRQIPPSTTVGAFGTLSTDARGYHPLDTVTVRIGGRAAPDSKCRIRVCDPNQRAYFEADVALTDNRGETQFTAAAPLGAHYIYLTWPGEKKYSRYLNFQVDAETDIASGDADFDRLYPFTRDALKLGRRQYQTPRGKFVGYISADTRHFDGIWLRDSIYGMPAYRHWERDITCGLERFLEAQSDDGMVPDGIERDGRTWRVGLESDVEYIAALGVWQSWQASGDDAWMAAALPRLEKALHYIQNDPKHWDAKHRLIKRQHSCDTWDFDINGATDKGQGRHVIATCDQSGYYLAFRAMGQMYAHLGRQSDAKRWTDEAEAYRRRAADLLWDGTKFLHHVHLDPIDHAHFDERNQLAMGNTWAMTRGLATAEQSRKIVDEYRRRQQTTGDAYPWWSLQPGYPDELGYFKQPFCKQGGYANGGLMPWVGGELCRGAFACGREGYAVQLLRQYADHLRRTGGAKVWYWPNGEPGFRTTNEVDYGGWNMGNWIDALVEGLAGLRDAECQMSEMSVSPRWAATPVREVRAIARYAASDACFAYRMQIDPAAATITLTFTGSGKGADFSVLLPEGWTPKSLTLADGEGKEAHAAEFKATSMDASRYVVFQAAVAGVGKAVIQCEGTK